MEAALAASISNAAADATEIFGAMAGGQEQYNVFLDTTAAAAAPPRMHSGQHEYYKPKSSSSKACSIANKY
jgi:hypothetical protein